MCKECEKNPVWIFTNKRKVCKKCFIRYFQKKFFYTVRKFKLFGREEIIYYDSNGVKGKVLEELLMELKSKLALELIKSSSRKYDKNVLTTSLDDTSYDVVKELLKGDLVKKNLNIKEGKTVKPLYLFLDAEIFLYAKLRGIKASGKEKNSLEKKLIDGLEKNHPEIKNAIVNSYLELFS